MSASGRPRCSSRRFFGPSWPVLVSWSFRITPMCFTVVSKDFNGFLNLYNVYCLDVLRRPTLARDDFWWALVCRLEAMFNLKLLSFQAMSNLPRILRYDRHLENAPGSPRSARDGAKCGQDGCLGRVLGSSWHHLGHMFLVVRLLSSVSKGPFSQEAPQPVLIYLKRRQHGLERPQDGFRRCRSYRKMRYKMNLAWKWL